MKMEISIDGRRGEILEQRRFRGHKSFIPVWKVRFTNRWTDLAGVQQHTLKCIRYITIDPDDGTVEWADNYREW